MVDVHTQWIVAEVQRGTHYLLHESAPISEVCTWNEPRARHLPRSQQPSAPLAKRLAQIRSATDSRAKGVHAS